jgi:hypothetical protein
MLDFDPALARFAEIVDCMPFCRAKTEFRKMSPSGGVVLLRTWRQPQRLADDLGRGDCVENFGLRRPLPPMRVSRSGPHTRWNENLG